MYPGSSFATSLAISSVGATLAGGSSTTVSTSLGVLQWRPCFFFCHTFVSDVLSAGLDAGYAIGLILIFFALQYPKNGTIGQNSVLTWWGNTVYTKTADYTGVPYKSIAEGEIFGPSSW